MPPKATTTPQPDAIPAPVTDVTPPVEAAPVDPVQQLDPVAPVEAAPVEAAPVEVRTAWEVLAEADKTLDKMHRRSVAVLKGWLTHQEVTQAEFTQAVADYRATVIR